MLWFSIPVRGVPQSTLSSLLMTIIILATERSDPVAPHRVGVSMCVCVPVCVCVYINLWGASQLLLIVFSKKPRVFTGPAISAGTNSNNNSTSHNCFFILAYIQLKAHVGIKLKNCTLSTWKHENKCIWDVLKVYSVIWLLRPLQMGVSDAKLKPNGKCNEAPICKQPCTFCLCVEVVVMFLDFFEKPKSNLGIWVCKIPLKKILFFAFVRERSHLISLWVLERYFDTKCNLNVDQSPLETRSVKFIVMA